VPALKKLLKLKEWLTVPDAARHLSILFGEDVAVADVLQLALDGHLTLSVNFVNHAEAQCGRIIPLADAKREVIKISENEFFHTIEGLYIGDDRVFSYGTDITSIEGVWDLAMLGTERIDVEHNYQFLTGGPAVDLTNLEGPLVNHPDGTWARIVDHFSDNEFFNKKNLKSPRNHPHNYYPAGGLPSDAVFVVRTSALQNLEAHISEPEPGTERPVGRRERSTLLVIIAALAKLARIDVAKASSAAASIESQTALMGTRVAARTIENHLKRIPEALEDKAED
jgi:hypothetical protein